MPEKEVNKGISSNLSVKDLVSWFIIALTLVGGYWKMNNSTQSTITELSIKVEAHEKTLNDNNLELLSYKLDEVKESIDKLSDIVELWSKQQISEK